MRVKHTQSKIAGMLSFFFLGIFIVLATTGISGINGSNFAVSLFSLKKDIPNIKNLEKGIELLFIKEQQVNSLTEVIEKVRYVSDETMRSEIISDFSSTGFKLNANSLKFSDHISVSGISSGLVKVEFVGEISSKNILNFMKIFDSPKRFRYVENIRITPKDSVALFAVSLKKGRGLDDIEPMIAIMKNTAETNTSTLEVAMSMLVLANTGR